MSKSIQHFPYNAAASIPPMYPKPKHLMDMPEGKYAVVLKTMSGGFKENIKAIVSAKSAADAISELQLYIFLHLDTVFPDLDKHQRNRQYDRFKGYIGSGVGLPQGNPAFAVNDYDAWHSPHTREIKIV